MFNEWQIMDSGMGWAGGSQFQLYNPAYNECMVAANVSDSNGTPVVLGACTVGGAGQANAMALG